MNNIKLPNPWLSIWTEPRQTMHQLNQTHSYKYVLGLSLFSITIQLLTILSALFFDKDLQVNGLGQWAPLVTALGILFCLLVYLLYLYVLKVVAGWLGSQTKVQNLVYVAWVYIASTWFIVPLMFLIISTDKLSGLYPQLMTTSVLSAIKIAYKIASLQISYTVLLCLSEILNFSRLRTFACVAITLIINVILIVIIGTILFTLFNLAGYEIEFIKASK